MNTPHAVILHITEKNCSIDELNRLISLLKDNHHFCQLGGPSFDSNKNHLGTNLIKPVKGKNAKAIIELVIKELNNVKTETMVRFNCQLTVAATTVESDTVFIQ